MIQTVDPVEFEESLATATSSRTGSSSGVSMLYAKGFCGSPSSPVPRSCSFDSLNARACAEAKTSAQVRKCWISDSRLIVRDTPRAQPGVRTARLPLHPRVLLKE